MKQERIFLYSDRKDVYIDVYKADPVMGKVCDGLLVIPGGGYDMVYSGREGEPVALNFLAKGYNTFILHYSVAQKSKFPQPLIDASLAMKHIKDNCNEYNINPDRVFVMGFSAGGHLSLSLGTMWDTKEIYDAVDMPYGYNKPKGIVLGYPVVSGLVKDTHFHSFQNITGQENPGEDELVKYSHEKLINKNTPPMYIMATSTDEQVSVRNALALASALTEAGVLYELHIFKDAIHGMSLANRVSNDGEKFKIDNMIAHWTVEADEWMQNI
ncbi:MAG: alpha/beta hydrolase [Clostridia bacterium]|nr:alpha/beta hydrolase [Clostridia bacterium]